MPEHRLLRERIQRSEALLGMFVNLGSPMAAELCGRAGFDWLVLDLEHGAADESGLLALLHAVAATPATAVVRVEEGTRLRIGRALDLGATAIMVPRVDTAAEAETVVRYLRYPPAGTRGVALPTRGAGFGALGHADVGTYHERVTGIIQIESTAALDAADEIAAIDGVDVLFVGPTDLSHALGIPGRIDDPAYLDAAGRVARAAAEHGKAAGILLWTAEDAERYVGLGYRFIALGSDAGHVANGARLAASALRGAMEDP